jgi:hypothetical protein
MPDVLKSNGSASSVDRPRARARILSARFTHAEYSELEKHAWSKGMTLADWVHETLIGETRDRLSGSIEMHIFVELVAIQMLLMGTLEPLLRDETRTADQVAHLFRQVQTTKAARAQELLARRSQKKETL